MRGKSVRTIAGAAIAAFAGVAAASAAFAQDATGNWLRPSTGAVLNFCNCGGGLCAEIVSVKDTAKKGNVGKIIMNGATKSGANTWTGSILNTDDDKTYSGEVQLVAGGLNLKGCVLGGIICKSEMLTRVK